MQRSDYIERLIEQIVAVIAAVTGLAGQKKFEEAERELDGAWTALLGFRRADAHRLDDATLKMMLGAKASAAARLFEAEATVEEARGNASKADALRKRAQRQR
jgi:hypothetical protein